MEFHAPQLAGSNAVDSATVAGTASSGMSVRTAKAWQLARIVREQQQQLATLTAHQVSLQAKRDTLQSDLLVIRRDALALGLHILTVDRLQHQHTRDAALADFLVAKTDAVAAKLDNLKFDLLRRTYTAEAVAGLREIRALLDSRDAELSHQQSRLTDKLTQYTAIGGMQGPLAPLVRQYADLLEQIDMCVWQIRTLDGGKWWRWWGRRTDIYAMCGERVRGRLMEICGCCVFRGFGGSGAIGA
jgi:hypothetical protein